MLIVRILLSPHALSISRAYVNSLNWILDVWPSYPTLHSSPGRTWILWIEYSMSDHPIPSSPSVSRKYVNLVHYLRPLIWPSYSILFICLQTVRELSSIVLRPLIWSSYPIPSSASSSYVNLINRLKTSHLIILFHPFHPMEREDQMKCIQTIDQVHVRSWDGWRWDEMTWNNWPSSRMFCQRRRVKRTGYDDQMRGIQTVDLVYVRSSCGYRWREWDRMIRWEVLK